MFKFFLAPGGLSPRASLGGRPPKVFPPSRNPGGTAEYFVQFHNYLYDKIRITDPWFWFFISDYHSKGSKHFYYINITRAGSIFILIFEEPPHWRNGIESLKFKCNKREEQRVGEKQQKILIEISRVARIYFYFRFSLRTCLNCDLSSSSLWFLGREKGVEI